MLLERVNACQVEEDTRWKLRHLLPRLEQVRAGPGAGRAPGPFGRAGAPGGGGPRTARARRLVFDPGAGGLELRPFVGGKGAFLGEIARVLGNRAVPPWFAVADAAFQQVLATPAPPPVLDRLGLARTSSLEEAIDRVMERPDWESRRQSACDPRALAGDAAPGPAGGGGLDGLPRPLGPGQAGSSGRHPLLRLRGGLGGGELGGGVRHVPVRGRPGGRARARQAGLGRVLDGARHRTPPQRWELRRFARGGGIVVQRMVDARVSGVLHTVYAAAGQLREMVINVGLGLGEGIVSGTVDVDHVLVAKDGDRSARGSPASLPDRRQARAGGLRQEARHRDEARGDPLPPEVPRRPRVRGAVRPGAGGLPAGGGVRAAARHRVRVRGPATSSSCRPARFPLFDGAWRETLARYPLRVPPRARDGGHMIRKEDALRYHSGDRPGKVEVKATKACLSPREIRLAYLPGATFPASEIAADAAASYLYTARGNLVGVITNGTAVPGLGGVGAAAAKPVQEGIAVLFKTPRRHRRLRPGARHHLGGGLHPRGADARADLRRDQPEGPPRPGGARHLRPAGRDDADPGVPREPLRHGGGGPGGPDQRARARGQAPGGDPRGHLRRGDGRARAARASWAPWAFRPRTSCSTTSGGSFTPGARTSPTYQRAFARGGPAVARRGAGRGRRLPGGLGGRDRRRGP